jgi:hypothetical protein
MLTRKAVFLDEGLPVFVAFYWSRRARNNGNPDLHRWHIAQSAELWVICGDNVTESSCFRLVAKAINNFGRWTYKSQTCLLDFPGKPGIFRKETIAERENLVDDCSFIEGTDLLPGVNHIDTMLESDPNDVVLSEIGAYWSQTLSNLISFVGLYL